MNTSFYRFNTSLVSRAENFAQISRYFKLCGLYGSGVVPPFAL